MSGAREAMRGSCLCGAVTFEVALADLIDFLHGKSPGPA